jgi:hypothetical protein
MWNLPTSTQLRATWHTDSLDMVVLPSTGDSRYHNCCIDGGTTLLHVSVSWGSHREASCIKSITHWLLLLQLYTEKYNWHSSSRLIQNICKKLCLGKFFIIFKNIVNTLLIWISFFVFVLGATAPPVGQVSRSNTATHTSGRVISSSQRPLPDNIKHSQQTDIHAPRWDLIPQSQQTSGRRPKP